MTSPVLNFRTPDLDELKTPQFTNTTFFTNGILFKAMDKNIAV
jgi:hypothetical protein